MSHNLFAYCNNNPVNMVDSAGNYPVPNDPAGIAGEVLGTMLSDWFRERIEKDRTAIALGKVTKVQTAPTNTRVLNSHLVKNPLVMAEYIHANLGDEITGTTIGAIVEWIVHNVAYDVGLTLSNSNIPAVSELGMEAMKKGEHLDIGPTIYYDNHDVFTVIMWTGYNALLPAPAKIDYFITTLEKGIYWEVGWAWRNLIK